MKRKIVSAVLVLAMVAGLTACGGTTDSGSTSGSSSESTSESSSGSDATVEAGDIDTSEHVVITYLTTGDAPSGEAKENLDKMLAELNAILTEKCNAEIAVSYTGWTDYLSVYNLTLAQMDGTVDLVGTASDWLDAWPNSKNGAFLPLSESMLQTYAPQTWASVSPEHWELCKYDGDIYLMPEDNYAQWTNHGFIYRNDWAAAAGLSNGVNSWEELTTYLEYVTANASDLGITVAWNSDGTNGVQMASGWVASHTNYVPIDGISTGGLWGGTSDDLYTLITPAYTDTDMMVEYATMMKKWSDMGVCPTDVLNNVSSDNRSEFRQGLVALEQHHTQTWTDLCSPGIDDNKALQENPDASVGFFYFGEETKNVVSLNITHGAMAVSAGSKNPERALMVYDLIRNDEECYKLFNYGIEGVSYEINADGLRTTPASYDPDTQNINGMTNYWWGRNDDLEVLDARKNWDSIDVLYKEYDGIKIDYPYGQFIPDMDNIQSMVNNVEAAYDEYMKLISYGKFQGTPEEIVAEMQAALKAAGIEEVTAELQSQIDAMYK